MIIDASAVGSPLGQVRVIDLSSGVAGQYCAKLFALSGADVTLVEPPGGTPTRRRPPFVDGGRHSALFRHLNQGKQAMTCPADLEERDDLIRKLLAAADVVISDGNAPPGLPETVIDCRISEFPAGSPYENWRADEMIHQALSGYMNATGRADRQPVYGLGQRGYYACGTTAYTSVLAALHARRQSGIGGRVSISVFESVAAIGQNFVTQAEYNGTTETRARYTGLLATLRCADGYVVMFAIRDPRAVCRVFDADHLVTDPRFAQAGSMVRNWDVLVENFADRAAQLTTDEVVARAQRLRISCERVWRIDELLSSAQWRDRHMVQVVESSDGHREPSLAPVFRIDNAGADASLSTTPSSNPEPRRRPKLHAEQVPARAAGPLHGIRVLDLTVAWAGPMATRSLAWLGADVIKIESPGRPDAWRGFVSGGPAHHYPDLTPGPRPYNRDLLFNTQNHDKRALAIDLKIPEAKEIFYRLVERSDVVLANFTPGVLDRLGIGFSALSKINSQIVVVEMPAFGSTGPMSTHLGMGKTMEAACGMASLLGYADDDVPLLTGPAILDPIGGLNGAAATLTALEQRDRDGRGVHVEVAQTEAAAHWIGEFIHEQATNGSIAFANDGNRIPEACPHEAFPSAGDDQWVAISIPDDASWRALCEVLGRTDLATDPDLGSLPGRQANQARIESSITEWTRGLSKFEAAEMLQRAGVPAAPVNDGLDVAQDPALQACGFLHAVTHPEAGTHRYPGLAYRVDDWDLRIRRPAPCFGEHNREILADLLGLSDVEIDDLYRVGAIADEPDSARDERDRTQQKGDSNAGHP